MIKGMVALAFSAAVALPMSGCYLQDMIENVDGFEVGINCQLDAFFNANNCKPRGRLHRKMSSTTPLNLSSFSVQFSASGGSLAALPTAAAVTVFSGGAVVGYQVFGLVPISADTVVLADAVAAQNFVNSFGSSVDVVEYEMNDLVATAVVGMNSVGSTAWVSGGVAGAATYSSYVAVLPQPDQPL